MAEALKIMERCVIQIVNTRGWSKDDSAVNAVSTLHHAMRYLVLHGSHQ